MAANPAGSFPSTTSDEGYPAVRAVGLVLVVLGLVVITVAVFVAIRFFPDVDSYPRATGDRTEVELTAGRWTVFAEGDGRAPERIDAPDGTIVELRALGSSQNYDLNGRSGVAVGSITATVDGTYVVTAQPGETYAFGQNFGRRLATALVAGIVGGLAGAVCLLAGVVALIVGRRRRTTSIR